jgi:flagellin-like hook-associated protein FlgL
MRIASHTISEALAQSVAKNQEAYSAEQIRVASGKKYQLRSAGGVAAAQAANLQQSQSISAQFRSNIQQASTWATVGESRLTSIVDQVARVQEIAVEAGDTTLASDGGTALAEELNGLLDDLLAQANAEFQGSPLFGGAGGTQPATATRDADGHITSVSYASGTDTARTVKADASTVVEYGVSATGPDGVFADSGSGRDLFQSIIDLRDQIESGTAPTDATVGQLSDAFDGVTQALVRTGVQSNRLTTLEQQSQALDVTNQERLSDLEDTDMAAAISRLSQLEASLQASLQLASTIGDFALAKYI